MHCGIYAVANAFYILSGTDVLNIKIDENRMRAHFLQCLELGRFEPFPEKQKNTITLFSPEKITRVEVFCICKIPWVWYHSKNPDLNMIECDTCHIPRDVKTSLVMCSTCLKDRWNGTIQIVKKYTLTDDYDFRIILAEL